MAPSTDGSRDGPPRALLIAAIAVAGVAVAAVLVIAATRQSPPQQPVVIASVPAPQAGSPECEAVRSALPEDLGDYRRAATADPTPAGAAAWRAADDSEPVILRCGLDRPAEFVVGAPIQVVDAVGWFEVADDTGSDRSTWFAVDRPVYIALTLPQGSGPTPIQQISEVIAATMPAKPIDPAPAR
ncbi:MAG: DUF3515 domain-containing protein [Mycobacterium sp.]